ncbi:MAG: DNA (cytosine-5-)-methyltransferase [Bryobacteraceae bacterium]|nr:DNA (cytosine-5-)-methyltransferase [Bryobacteraceae bacterium]
MIACVDIFCGVGGLTHGLTRGGVGVVAGIDVDPECKFPYETNNTANFLQKDISSVSGDDLRSLWANEPYSLLAGCAPCQPFSTYGRRKDKHPKSKQKWGLVSEFARLVRESRPDFVTMENVPQLIDHAVFKDFVSSFPEYHLWWDVINCVGYNVPQTRKRLVLLASRLGPVSLHSDSSLINEQGSQLTVRKAIGHLRPLRAGQSDPNDSLHSACRLSPLNLQRIKASKPGGTWRDWNSDLVAKCHKKASGETYPGVYGRMGWDDPAPTITTQSFGYGNGRFGHPQQNRAITLREAAILQTFPESYRFLPSGERVRFSVLGKLIGNAVPVQIGEAIARSLLLHVLESKTQKEVAPTKPLTRLKRSSDKKKATKKPL